MSIYEKNSEGKRPIGFFNLTPYYTHDEFVTGARRNPEILDVQELIRFMRKKHYLSFRESGCFACMFLDCNDIKSVTTDAEFALLVEYQKAVRAKKAAKIKYTENSAGGRDYTRKQVLDRLSQRKRDQVEQKRTFWANQVQKSINDYLSGSVVVVETFTKVIGGYDNVTYFYSDGHSEGASYSND